MAASIHLCNICVNLRLVPVSKIVNNAAVESLRGPGIKHLWRQELTPKHDKGLILGQRTKVMLHRLQRQGIILTN